MTLLRRDIASFCFFSALAFVGFWSSIFYHRIDMIGTNTVTLLVDTFVTVIVVCVSSSIFTELLVKKMYRKRKLPPIRKDERFWRFFPNKPWSFGFVMGVYFSIFLSYIFDATYGFFDWTSITLTQFVTIKMAYSGALGAVLAILTIKRMLPVMPGE